MKIKLTESRLKQIVNESVKNVLSELDWRTYQTAANKANHLSDKAENEYEEQRRNIQRRKFQDKAGEMYSKQYNLIDFDYNQSLPQSERKQPSQGELKQASRRAKEMTNFYRGNQEYKNGSWQDKDYAPFTM
jgi:hypothetical protein